MSYEHIVHVEAKTEGQDLSLIAHDHLTSNFKIPNKVTMTPTGNETPSSLLLKAADHVYHCDVAISMLCWLRANLDSVLTHI